MILVAVRDAPQRESLRAALQREGWQVSVVGSLDSAYRMAADQAPQLVVLDSELPGSEELVKVFARRHGGPGILLLADAAGRGHGTSADAVLGREVGGEELVTEVRLCLAAPRPIAEAPAPAADDRRWTAQELFGEILEDLEAAVSAVEAGAPAEPDETPAALVRGTVPAETLAAPAGRQPRGEPAPPPAWAAGGIESREETFEHGEGDGAVEAMVATPAPPATGFGTEQPVPELELPPAPAEALPASPPEVAAPEAVPAEPMPSAAPPAEALEVEEEPASIAGSVLDLALAGDGDRSRPGELESLAEELLELARIRPAAAGPSPVLEISAEPEVTPQPEAAPEPEVAPALATPREVSVVAPEPEPPSEARVGAYRLVERLSSDEVLTAWQAARDDPQGGATTVILEVSRGLAARLPELAARAVAAAELAALLDHPTILTPLDAGIAGQDFFVATEPVTATSLERVLSAVRRLEVRIPLGLALGMGERIAAALEHAHSGGADAVVHGALDPRHVLLTRDGEVRVARFALARALEGEAATIAGRVRYRAPEQIAGEAPDPRSDLYSFGALLFEMVTGRPAFGGEDPAAVAHAVQHDAPDPPDRLDPTIPGEVSGLIARLLKRRREERVQGAGEARRKLDLALQALPSPPGAAELAAWIRQVEEAMRHARPPRPAVEGAAPAPEVPPPAAESWLPATPGVLEEAAAAHRRRWLVAALLAAGLALGGIAYWAGRDRYLRRVITVPPPASRPGAVLSVDRPAGTELESAADLAPATGQPQARPTEQGTEPPSVEGRPPVGEPTGEPDEPPPVAGERPPGD